MPIDQLDVPTQAASAPAVPASAAPPSPSHEEASNLRFLRDALVAEPQTDMPRGWHLYTTQKFIGRAALAAYALTVLSVWASPLLFWGDWIPVMLSPEAVLFSMPAAILGFWFAWTTSEEAAVAAQRSWRGRIVTTFILYWALQTSAALFHYTWMTLFRWT